MPLFDFSCQECGHNFESLVIDGEAVNCPYCHADDVTRLLSLPARPVSGDACRTDLPPCGPGCCRIGEPRELTRG
jgi:putative FmdB family regulatory protein